jgi:hypothetical protein
VTFIINHYLRRSDGIDEALGGLIGISFSSLGNEALAEVNEKISQHLRVIERAITYLEHARRGERGEHEIL